MATKPEPKPANPFKPWLEHMKSEGKPREPKKEQRPPQSKKWHE